MKLRSIGIAVAVILSSCGPVLAQGAWPSQGPAVGYPGGYQPQQWPPASYPGAYQRYPFPGLDPSDAYRQHLINRWELEQLEGPLPPALQGPSPNGDQEIGR